MRAQVLTAFNNPYTLKTDYPEPPAPTGGDLLLRVDAASYCHTDAVYATGAMPPATLPRIGCHEFAGEVLSHGPSVSSSLKHQLPTGTKVGVPNRAYRPCGQCRECLENYDEEKGYCVYCPRAGRLGLSVDGGFQDYVLVDSRQVVPIPAPLTPLETAPLMCAGWTIYAALRKAEEACKGSIGNKSIGISGAGGGLGHLGIQFAVKLGWGRVVAIDAADDPLNLVKSVTANLSGDDSKKISIVDARAETAVAAVARLFGPVEPDFAVLSGLDAMIILPESQAAFDYGVTMLRNHAVCVVVSFPTAGFNVSSRDLIFRDIRVVGSLIGTKKQLRETLEVAAKEGIRASLRVFPLEELNGLVEEYHRGGGGKLVVDLGLKK